MPTRRPVAALAVAAGLVVIAGATTGLSDQTAGRRSRPRVARMRPLRGSSPPGLLSGAERRDAGGETGSYRGTIAPVPAAPLTSDQALVPGSHGMRASARPAEVADRAVPRVRSTGPGRPMPAPMTDCRSTGASARTSSTIRAAASRAARASWLTSRSHRRSASTLCPMSATATATWLCPKSIPTAASEESRSLSRTPGRPPRESGTPISTSCKTPEPFSSETSVCTVVRERPVTRAMSAWLIRPRSRRTPTTRSRFRSRSQRSVPSPCFATLTGNHGRRRGFVKSLNMPFGAHDRTLDKRLDSRHALHRAGQLPPWALE